MQVDVILLQLDSVQETVNVDYHGQENVQIMEVEAVFIADILEHMEVVYVQRTKQL
jgi:hypothetical protein